MSRLHIALMVLGVCATGWVAIIQGKRRLNAKLIAAATFLQHVQSYMQGQGSDTYSWLLRHSHQMQEDMAGFGVMGHFKPPFANYMIPNWPVVLNALPAMRQWADEGFGSGPHEQFFQYGTLLQEALLRYVGAPEGQTKEIDGEIRNPFKWFRHGMQLVLLLPFTILRWLGLEAVPELRVLAGKAVVKVPLALATVAAFIASVVTIIEGWDKTISFAKTVGAPLLQRLHH
jgi:hypothetical protein